ncbi:MAG: hypothetical protein MK137_02100 [Rickettsiales bacterium]|nr:hypothetical protein [Rickettsiales bacterium]
MKLISTKLTILLLCLGVLLFIVPKAHAEKDAIKEFRFEVDDVVLHCFEGKSLHIMLDTKHAEAFSDFTTQNRGQKARVFLADEVIIEAEIKLPITSGRMTATSKDAVQRSRLKGLFNSKMMLCDQIKKAVDN